MNNPFIVDEHFKQRDFTKIPLARADYEECVFEDCQFQNGFLDNQNFVDCTFKGCDLSNTNIAHTLWNNVHFMSCKMVGIPFDKSATSLFRVTFSKCNLTLAQFYGLELEKTSFKGSNLSQADFTKAILKAADFTDCNLDKAIFEGTNLERANFTKAFNFTIDPELNSLKRATFNKETVSGLLKKYDIVVD